MMKKIIVFMFLMIIGVCPSLNCCFPTIQKVFAADNTTVVKSYLKQARFLYDNKDFSSSLQIVDKALGIDPKNKEALDLKKKINESIQAQNAKDKADFDKACNSGTISDLKSFVTLHPNSIYIVDARNRIEEYQLWMEAKAKNTKEAYQNYLNRSKTQAYRPDALQCISNIESIEVWPSFKNTTNPSVLEDFLSAYPDSPYASEAEYLRNLLIAEQKYNLNDSQAIYYYEKAKSINALSGTHKSHYEQLQLERDCQRWINSSDVSELRLALTKVPHSNRYYNQISNRYATILAKNLDRYSTSVDYDIARKYAKDKYTRNLVDSYIKAAKQSKKRFTYKARKSYDGFFFTEYTYGGQATPYGFSIGGGIKQGGYGSVRFKLGDFSLYDYDYSDSDKEEGNVVVCGGYLNRLTPWLILNLGIGFSYYGQEAQKSYEYEEEVGFVLDAGLRLKLGYLSLSAGYQKTFTQYDGSGLVLGVGIVF